MQCNFVVDSNGAGAILRMDKNAAIIGKFTLVERSSLVSVLFTRASKRAG